MSESLDDRDVLLLAQILHSRNISDTDKLAATDDKVIEEMVAQWRDHPSTRLEHKTLDVDTPEDFRRIYSELLTSYNVANTVQLANLSYFARIRALEGLIEGYKQEFRQALV